MDRTALAGRLGVSYQAVRQAIVKGAGMSTENLFNAARVLGVSPLWLAMGDGPMRPRELSLMARDVAEWFDALPDEARRTRAYSIIYQMCVRDRWPLEPSEASVAVPTPAPEGGQKKHRA